jgi:F-type H+-transporting ATPase subunit delta
MKVSKQARRDGKQLFRACQVSGALDENRVRQAVQQVIALKPRGYVAVLGQLQRLVKLDLERRAARVESAVPLEPAMQAALRESLTRQYGRELNFSFKQNPALLGGLRIQVGSDVYDGSVQGRLERLKDSF